MNQDLSYIGHHKMAGILAEHGIKKLLHVIGMIIFAHFFRLQDRDNLLKDAFEASLEKKFHGFD